jgi:hypothetical protein
LNKHLQWSRFLLLLPAWERAQLSWRLLTRI